MDKNTAETIGKRVHRYMLGKATSENVTELLLLLKNAEVGIGAHLSFRYVETVGQDIIVRQYDVRCPFCRKPTVYFFADFGPGCSGWLNGGCGYKVPKEKRPWYSPPSGAGRGDVPQAAKKK